MCRAVLITDAFELVCQCVFFAFEIIKLESVHCHSEHAKAGFSYLHFPGLDEISVTVYGLQD